MSRSPGAGHPGGPGRGRHGGSDRAWPGGAGRARSGGADRARLFVALTLEADVCARLAAWAGQILGEAPGARLLAADALHLTLCFLGSVSLEAVDGIAAATADVVRAEASGPLGFGLDQALWLPPRRPRVCALSLRDRDGRAGALQAALSQRLAEGGWYEPERRRWLAHVTVARLGRGGPRAVPEAPVPPVLDEPVLARAVALMRSWPGSRYESLAQIAL